ncbi:hypothetical protein BDW75DRAFT_225333 [Aspergillus navahoensis]
MENPFTLGAPKPTRVRMKKACDHCRRSKIRCEKVEGSASCTACERKGYACIISPEHCPPLLSSHAFCPGLPTVGQDASSFISFRQRSKILLHDWIYGNIRTRDIQTIPNLLKDIDQDYQRNLTLAFSRLAVVDDLTNVPGGSAEGKNMFSSHVPFPLPPEAEVLQIILTFSQCTVSVLPLFRDKVEEWLAERTYLAPRLPEDVTTWAALNVVLAMGYTLHLLRHPECEQDKFKYKQYLQNALATIPRLILDPPSLTSIQALFGMACLLNSSFELPSTHALFAIAIQQAHTLGIHRADLADPNSNSEQRNRVFWVGYILDKMICAVQGLGPYEDEANSIIALPEPDSQNDPLPLFNLFSRLCIIKGRIFKTIYTKASIRPPQPHPASDNQISPTESLESELSNWRQSLPPGIESSLRDMETTSSTRLAIVVLLLTYHQSIITLYKPVYFPSEARGGSNSRRRPINIRILSCLNSARKTAELVRYYPVYVPLGGRSLLSYVFTSLVILTMYVLDDPVAETAISDLQLARELSVFISDLVQASHTVEAGRLQALNSVIRASQYQVESAERAIRQAHIMLG